MTREEIGWSWLDANFKNWRETFSNIECMPYKTCGQEAIEFYNPDTDEVYHHLLITSGMLSDLLAGKNPKKVRNQYQNSK